jgi:hypothetical protein
VDYLDGSAYPIFSNNTVLTAHVTEAENNIGPFSDINGMKLGDKTISMPMGRSISIKCRRAGRSCPPVFPRPSSTENTIGFVPIPVFYLSKDHYMTCFMSIGTGSQALPCGCKGVSKVFKKTAMYLRNVRGMTPAC